MDVLTRRVRAKRLATDRKVLAQTGMAVAMAALEAGVANRPLAASNESVGLRKEARFDLPHQEVHVGRDHFHVFWENNVPTQ